MDIRETDQPVKRQKLERQKRPLVLNIFTQSCCNTQPAALWSYPGDISTKYLTTEYWTNLAKKAEKAKLNAIFIADVLGPYDVYNGPNNYSYVAKAGTQFPGIDPAIPIAAMAAVTKSVGFGVTFSTISEHPYLFARKLATLDHMTNGRVGWNIVSTYLNSAAKNLLNGEQLPEKLTRYAKTDEYVQVVAELMLSSFRQDAIKADPKTKTYADPSLIRPIDFDGKWYKVPGPSYSSPSPQGLPVLFEAGTSSGGLDLASKWGEVVFSYGPTPSTLRVTSDRLRSVAQEKYKRDPESMKLLVLVMVIVGETEEEAWEKFDKYAEYSDHEAAIAMVGGWMNVDYSKYPEDFDLLQSDNFRDREVVKHFCVNILDDGPITKSVLGKHVSVKGSADLIIGSVDQAVQKLIDYVEIGGADGFNFAAAVNPDTFDDLIDLVIPKLRERGYAWDDYPVAGGTFRENLYGIKGQSYFPKEHPAYGYRWIEGNRGEFEKQLEKHKEILLKKQGDAWKTE
jgi:FMN-dependent oxidoreductase (nitrilotriacetate monooxygenase family)